MLLRALAAILSLVLAAGAGAQAPEPSPHAIEIPSWFAKSFLDFREDVREAAGQGKRVMVYFGQDGCPYCQRLMRANFTQRDIVEALRTRFVAIDVNLWGDRETTWTDGVRRTEKVLATHLRVQFTPTLVFLDESGREVLRLNGYQPPVRFRLAVEYAARARPEGERFAAFIRAHPEGARRSAGPPEDVFREPPATVAFPRPSPQLLVFESPDCDACDEALTALAHPESRAALGRLGALRVNVAGGRTLTHGGVTLTESEWARRLGIAFTPALVFFDERGREVFRADGYLRRFHLAATIDYVVEGAYRKEPSFQRYLQARADRERSAGRSVDLWK